MKTTLPELPANEARKWFIVDASKKPLGRMAVVIANKLRGKDRPDFSPAVDTGAFVVVINAEKAVLTGKKDEMKTYQDYTGWRAGLKTYTAKTIREKHPERMIEDAVWGMLPKNNTAVTRMTRLKVYAGSEHPHAAQKPEILDI